MGIHPLEGHPRLGKDIVRGIKLKEMTFTPLVRKLKGPAAQWQRIGTLIDLHLREILNWRRDFWMKTSSLTFNLKVSLALLPSRVFISGT